MKENEAVRSKQPMCSFNEDTKQKINDIHKVIYGNGTSKGSIIDRLARIETNLGIHWALLAIVVCSIVKMAFF